MKYENLTPVVGVITNISTQEGDCNNALSNGSV